MDNKDRKVDNWCFYFCFSCFVPSFSRSGLVLLVSFVVGCNCHFQVSIGSPCHHHLFHSQFIFPSNFPSPSWATNFPVSVFPSQLCGRGPGVRRECPLFFFPSLSRCPYPIPIPIPFNPYSDLRTPYSVSTIPRKSRSPRSHFLDLNPNPIRPESHSGTRSVSPPVQPEGPGPTASGGALRTAPIESVD